MQYIPLAVVLMGLAVSLCILLMGLVMTYQVGGWHAMMRPTSESHWSRPRCLVYGGAMGAVVCNCAFVVLVWIPGALPWR